MIEAIIQFFYNKTHKKSTMFIATGKPRFFIAYDMFNHKELYDIEVDFPKGNLFIHHRDKSVIHDITDDRIIKL